MTDNTCHVIARVCCSRVAGLRGIQHARLDTTRGESSLQSASSILILIVVTSSSSSSWVSSAAKTPDFSQRSAYVLTCYHRNYRVFKALVSCGGNLCLTMGGNEAGGFGGRKSISQRGPGAEPHHGQGDEVPQLLSMYYFLFYPSNSQSPPKRLTYGDLPRGGATVLKVGGGQFCERSKPKNFFDPPLFGQWGDKILLR